MKRIIFTLPGEEGELWHFVREGPGRGEPFSTEASRSMLAELRKEEQRPLVVCLCGSTKFKEAFRAAEVRLTDEGKIFLTVGFFTHADRALREVTPEEKEAFDVLHRCKIDIADEILVLNVGGYIGESTRAEITYARTLGKTVRFLEPYCDWWLISDQVRLKVRGALEKAIGRMDAVCRQSDEPCGISDVLEGVLHDFESGCHVTTAVPEDFREEG